MLKTPKNPSAGRIASIWVIPYQYFSTQFSKNFSNETPEVAQ